jgi:hypothetical protein
MNTNDFGCNGQPHSKGGDADPWGIVDDLLKLEAVQS